MLRVPRAAGEHLAEALELEHHGSPVKQVLLSSDFMNEETEDSRRLPRTLVLRALWASWSAVPTLAEAPTPRRQTSVLWPRQRLDHPRRDR